MILISLRKVKKSFGEKEVLKDVNLDIKEKEILGLVGNNGCGKTTLANILIGKESLDVGTIKKYKDNLKIGYLKQSTSYDSNSFTDLVINKTIDSFFEISSYLGLEKVHNWTKDRLNNLSGGEKTKLSLTEIWNSKPDLLILDEPTNHLDYKGIEWLIEEIKKINLTIIIISHDRYFLDEVTEKIAEIDNGQINIYNGNYTYYRKKKEQIFQNQLHQYEEQKKRERRIDGEIKRLKRWSHIAHRDSTKKDGFKEYFRMKAKKKDIQIKSAIKRLEKLKKDGVERPVEEKNVLFEFVSENKRGKSIINANQLSKQYDGRYLFEKSNFYISRCERVGLIGINGCGKTTLIKMILGKEKQTNGDLWISETLKIAYLSQDVLDLDINKTVLDMIKIYDKEKQGKIRTLLANIGITDRMIMQQISSLSLGERTRIKLIFLIIEENNVLILDEPTNHLDLHSREQLEETLLEYTGTIIIASHDRYLLEKITDKLLIFEDEKIRRIERGYKEYENGNEIKNTNNSKDEKMLINLRISDIILKMNKYNVDDEIYKKLDLEFKELIKKKNELS